MRVFTLICLFSDHKWTHSDIYSYEIYGVFFNKKQQITLLAPSFSTLEIYGVVYSLGLNYFRELA